MPLRLEEMNARVIDIRENRMGKYSQLGYHPEFKKIQAELNPHEYKACSSQSCLHPVQLFSGFYKDGDKLTPKCKSCNHNPAASAAAKQAKDNANAVVDATVTTAPLIDTETEAINNCLMSLHAAAGIKCLVNYEFRRADTIARRESWMAAPGVYLGEQVKADGVYGKDKDGVARRKPNNSEHTGRAQFAHCLGYGTLAMIFVKSRFRDATSDGIVRTLWVVDGALVTKDRMNENVDGTLGPQRFKPLPTGSAAELGAALDALVLGEAAKPLVPLETLFRDVQAPLQRKEMLLMIACRAIYSVGFEPGNQTVVDCLVDNAKTQTKTHNLVSGKVDMVHFVNGVRGQSYTHHDDLAQVLVGCVVKSGDQFFLMHALLSRHELLKNGVFRHNGYHGRVASAGNGNVSLLGGIYAGWLTKHKNKPDKRTKWLLNAQNKWRAPVELFPDDPKHGLTLADLEEVAQKAHNPAAFPSQAKIDREREELLQCLAHVAEECKEGDTEEGDADGPAAKRRRR